MHEYLTRVLGYSDDQAYRRLKAARLYNQVPEVAEKLKEGSLNLTQISEAQKSFDLVLKETGIPVALEKKNEILNSIAHTNNFQTKAILQEKLDLKPILTEKINPQSDKSIRVEITLSHEQFEKFKQIKSLLSHKIPSQNTSEVLNVQFDQFLDKHVFSKKIEPKSELIKYEENSKVEINKNNDDSNSISAVKLLTTEVARNFKKSRYISPSTRRQVYQRAKGCCEYINDKGHRCASSYQLEIDHIQAFSQNGSNEIENLRLICNNHNNFRASQMSIGFESTSHFLFSRCGAS